MNNTGKSSVIIYGDKENIWNAITDEKKLLQWYAPGSPWKIPNLNVGEKIFFTLMPNAHNNLTDKLPMTLTIKKVIPYQEFSFQLDSQKTVISFVLVKESNGIRVTTNLGGYDASLENLKALVEGKEIPNC
ncbi:SRPBCC domain-containing protein [Oceanobacillus polygoni]|uniref:Uncharacterized protein YndB with AHSA1/START domain n=1 Tax=Oceanobacillus polygoni TaxID=1235259 RepID=A0A9X0YWG8_9BACI|nr:SRPBCC domain-containing protein [Oceanobacillus polygoni]MBP2078605.1 uncharacterized protein YndB with AHSA1/START domain [Oceanobacillus polygoni]